MSIFSQRRTASEPNPGPRRGGLLRGQVTVVSPLTVRLWGDTGDAIVGLHDAGYTPVVGDPVYLGRLGGRLIVLGKVAES